MEVSTETQRTVYLLGQIYGCISNLLDGYNTPDKLQNAYCYPLNAVTQAYITALQGKNLTKRAEEYISVRLNDISPDFAELQPIQLSEIHSSFIVGMYHYSRSIRAVIDATGLTQAQIAEITGDKVQTIGRWYRGEFQVPEKKRYQIEKILLDKSIEMK